MPPFYPCDVRDQFTAFQFTTFITQPQFYFKSTVIGITGSCGCSNLIIDPDPLAPVLPRIDVPVTDDLITPFQCAGWLATDLQNNAQYFSISVYPNNESPGHVWLSIAAGLTPIPALTEVRITIFGAVAAVTDGEPCKPAPDGPISA